MAATTSKELPVLKKGDTGSSVKLLQNILIALDYLDSDSPTTNFQDQTHEAVRNFQEENDLKVDGIVGAKTWDKLGSILWD
ncbi:MAG: peptidoglycan-binding protein [Scytonema hyalinum WJT4-NPBG1]|jgi:N-acetylmuramoyl-L-alanine amidase|nr:peptidoglycan-binding protein [Scytonema hyalinum WJT4-NPBG1]